MTQISTDANEGNEKPLTREDKLESLAVNLMAVKRGVMDLEADAPNPFDAVDPAAPTGEMHTASDSQAVHQARESMKAAFAEVGIAETVASVIETIAEKFGLVI